jgi:LysM repeat protein
MAAKKPTRPRKFKQARKDALAQAKKDFSGKKQAGLKDRTLKISADDKKVLSDVKAEARGGYITDDRGNKINVKPTETAQERFARDRREAKAEIDRKYAAEDAKTAKTTSTNKPSALGARRLEQMKKAGISETEAKKVLDTNKPAYQKKAVKSKKKMGQVSKAVTETTKPKATKPAVKGFSAGKTLTPKGQAIYDDLVKQGVKPKSAMNKAVFRQEKTTPRIKITVDNKPTAPQPSAGAKAINEMGKKKGLTDVLGIEKKPADKLKTLEKKVTAAKSTAKKVTTVKAAKDASTGAKVGKAVLDAAKATAMIVGPGKFLKPVKFVQAAIAGNKAVKVTKAVKAAESGKKVAAANAARKAANAAKAEKAAKAGKMGKVKKVGLAAAGFYALDKIPTGGGSKPAATKTLPQRPAGQYPKGGGKGLKLGPNVQVNAGGSTTSYTVKKGDTLSGIAKTSGVKLSELLSANPTIADKKSKYKGGSMIWSGTKVKLPTKK